MKNTGCDLRKHNLPTFPPACFHHQEVLTDGGIYA